jgi:hypothetical protein
MTADSANTGATGGCLCGAVRYRVAGPVRRAVVACHCTTCRRFTGGLWTGTSAWRADVVIERDESLRWFRSSAEAERGFCSHCGSSLFWRGDNEPLMSLAVGCLDAPTGLELAVHSWISECADYWRFDATLPRRAEWSGLAEP